MEAVLQEPHFLDFGQDSLYPFARTGLSQIDGQDRAHLRSQVREYVPKSPGVYGMIDPKSRLVYVGKSKSLRNRLLSYFLPNNEEDKSGRIIDTTKSIVWETQPNEFAALLREQYLIRSFQPRFNVQGMPRRQQPVYVCLGRSPAEQLYISRKGDSKALCVIGPLFGAARATRAVEVLNRLFRLRDCSSKQPCSFTDQLRLFDIDMRPGCIRLEIDTCLGPCISACSRGEYDQQVIAAKAFLEGQSAQPIDDLEAAMMQAATNRHFEQAAVIREDLKAIEWLCRRTQDLAKAREHYTFVYPVEGTCDPKGSSGRRQDVWYLIRRGIVEGALAAPRNAAEKKQTTETLQKWLKDDHSIGSPYVPRPETLALVTSWFRNQRKELGQTFLPERLDSPGALHSTTKKAKAKTKNSGARSTKSKRSRKASSIAASSNRASAAQESAVKV